MDDRLLLAFCAQNQGDGAAGSGYALQEQKANDRELALKADEVLISEPTRLFGKREIESTVSARWIMALALLLLAAGWLPVTGNELLASRIFPTWLHTVCELAAVLVSLLVFASVWTASFHDRQHHTVLLGAGFMGVGLLDLAHLLSYKGMPDFITPAEPQKAIVFWLCARYLASLVLLTLALQPHARTTSRADRALMLALSLGFVLACLGLALWAPELWPRFFIEGQGLTKLKIVAEYGLILLLVPTALLLLRRGARARFNSADLASAAIISILSELCFTLYANVNDLYSLLGHLYKIAAYYFIFRAVFVVSVREPYRRLSEEIDEHRRTEQRLEYLAHHDPLTGLPNRVLLHDRIEQAMAQARRDGGKFAVVLMDLDQFKNVNDSLGHGAGDALLLAVAQRLRASLRETDTICRLGGDEFLLLFHDLREREAVLPILASLQAQLSTPVAVEGNEMRVSASFGVTFYPDDGRDLETLQRQADTAMYRAKDSGRNTFQFFDPSMHAQGMERMQLQHGLAKALEQGEFELHYQTQVELATGRRVGAEALLRWRRADGKLMPPAEFIPVAEQTGLIVPIGAWVLHEACRQAALWQNERQGRPRIAVNLSALQFRQGDIEATVQSALQASGLPPSQLELELTESILIGDPASVLATVTRLKAMGVKLAIDDFGTGYSSLAYLSRFPIDKLKIDRSFLHQLDDASQGAVIVEAIIGLARSLGLRTIAEGVETEAVAARLLQLGCQEAQGYYFARPVPASELFS